MRHLATSLAMALAALGPAVALAAPPAADAARAQSLVRQASGLEQRGDSRGARDALAQALALTPTPQIALALASTRAKLGELVEARDALVPVVYEPTPASEPIPESVARVTAKKTFQELGARIPHLRVEVATPHAGPLKLTLDGATLPPGAGRMPLPVNPGHHKLVVEAEGLVAVTTELDMTEGVARTLAIPMRSSIVATPPTAVAVVAPARTPPPAPVAPSLATPLVPVAYAAPAALPLPPPAPPQSVAPSAPGPTPAPQPVAAAPREAPGATQPFTREEAERASFSGGRYVVELLVSAVGGSLAAYGTYEALCSSGQSGCVIGGSLAALGANVVGTPLLVYGMGSLLGGRGTVGSAFMGALIPIGVSGSLTTVDPIVALGIGVALMPIVSPLTYEISSSVHAREMKAKLGLASLSPTVTPVVHDQRVVGGTAGFQGTF